MCLIFHHRYQVRPKMKKMYVSGNPNVPDFSPQVLKFFKDFWGDSPVQPYCFPIITLNKIKLFSNLLSQF